MNFIEPIVINRKWFAFSDRWYFVEWKGLQHCSMSDLWRTKSQKHNPLPSLEYRRCSQTSRCPLGGWHCPKVRTTKCKNRRHWNVALSLKNSNILFGWCIGHCTSLISVFTENPPLTSVVILGKVAKLGEPRFHLWIVMKVSQCRSKCSFPSFPQLLCLFLMALRTWWGHCLTYLPQS